MNLPCIIVDDEKLAREKITLFLSQMDWVEIIGSFATAKELNDAFPKLESHLLFLDVDLPDISGLELASLYHENNFIIFTTAYAEYAVDGFNLDAADYLLKPFGMTRFQKALAKVRNAIPVSSYLLIKVGKRTHRVKSSEVIYIEGMREYVVWHTDNGKIIEHSSMRSVVVRIADRGFVQIHKSYIINVARIEYFETDIVGLAGKEVPIGRKYKRAIDVLKLK